MKLSQINSSTAKVKRQKLSKLAQLLFLFPALASKPGKGGNNHR